MTNHATPRRATPRRTTAVTALAVLAGLVAGVPGVADAATPTARAPASGDAKIAAAGLLVLDDFAAGWKSSPPSKSNGFDAVAATVASCKKLVAARSTVDKHGTHATSRDFKKSDEIYSNSVAVLSSAAVASKVYAAYSADQGQRCLAKLAENAAKQSLSKSSSSAKTKISTTISTVAGASIGDASSRAEIELDVTGGIFPQKGYVDVVYVQTDRTVTVYQHVADTEQTDNHTLDQLIDASQRRLTAALAGQPLPDPNQPAALGTTQTAADGAVVTVYSVRAGVPGRYDDAQRFTVVDTQMCAQKGTSATLDASSYPVKLVFADNTSAQEEFGGPDPQFNDATLTNGACTRGNISYSPATSSPLTKIVYDIGDSDTKPLTWAAS
jgi:hypothetical protein